MKKWKKNESMKVVQEYSFLTITNLQDNIIMEIVVFRYTGLTLNNNSV